MDRETVKTIAAKVEDAVRAIGEEHGVQIKYKGGNYTESSAVLKLEVAEIRGGEAVTREAEDFRRYASLFGLRPEDLGREFKDWSGDAYKVVGAKPNSRKYPILVKNLTSGKTFKFPEGRVQAALSR
jgi:hypothetical protein